MKYLKKGMSEENLKESDEKTKEIVSNTLKEIEEKGDKAVRNLSISLINGIQNLLNCPLNK
ncbi:Uncharacterised protein [Mammaliicoccus lentus]|nr:Uncharacterised protein [Mammaliicoccus lentus]